MLRYAVKRIALAVVILITVMLAMYARVFLVPGDPARWRWDRARRRSLAALLRERMGLDEPVLWQPVWHFLRSAATGDLCDVWSKRPVLDQILEFFPNTLILGVAALGWAPTLRIALGATAVVWRDTVADRLLGTSSVGLISVPALVVAIYAILIFAARLRWLLAIGAGNPGDPLSQLRALVLPAFARWACWLGRLPRAACPRLAA